MPLSTQRAVTYVDADDQILQLLYILSYIYISLSRSYVLCAQVAECDEHDAADDAISEALLEVDNMAWPGAVLLTHSSSRSSHCSSCKFCIRQ